MTISVELTVALVTGAIAVIVSAVTFIMGRGDHKELASLTELRAQMEVTTTNLAVLKGIIEELRSENVTLRKRVQDLETAVIIKDRDIAARDARIAELESEVRRQSDELQVLREKVQTLEGKRKPKTGTLQ